MKPLPTFFKNHISGWKNWFNRESFATRTPVLDATELQALALFAESIPFSLFEFAHHTSQPLFGEILSSYRGRGFEFDENRVYQPGDEQRMINWRLYARTGDLYSKVFTEEHRPQLTLVMDRRSNMRFATRKQLKVILAAKIAACYFFQAQTQGLPVGGLFFDQDVSCLLPGGADQIARQRLLEELVAPCPPLPPETEQLALLQILQELPQRMPRGCFILLISDFSDLDPDSAAPVLSQLSSQHTIHAIQILDPIEQALPDSGDFLIEDAESLSPININAQDNDQNEQYRNEVNKRQARLRQCFKQNGILFKTCTTTDEPGDCLDVYNVE